MASAAAALLDQIRETDNDSLEHAIRPHVDYSLDAFVLDPDNRSVGNLDIIDAVVGAELELTIEGASTLTLEVEDPKLDLLQGNLLTGWTLGIGDRGEKAWIKEGRPIEAVLDDVNFRLAKVAKAGTRLTLTFEDLVVAKLRERKGARKAYRDRGVTRSEFVKSLCDAAGVKVYAHELHVAQQIAGVGSSRKVEETRRARSGRGIPSTAKLEGKPGSFLTKDQIRNANEVLDTAHSLNAGLKATLALVMACIIEAPNFSNPTGGEGSSAGILQLIAAWGTVAQRRDIARAVTMFLGDGFWRNRPRGAIELARSTDWSAAKIAQETQGSAFPDRYAQVKEQALKIIDAYGGASDSGEDRTVEVDKPYAFARGRNETSWDCIGRLADEVQWRRFVRGNWLIFMSEEDLFKQQPALEIAEGENGVHEINFEVDQAARNLVAELTVSAVAGRWTAATGMVATVAGMGPVDGRWLVTSVRPDLFGQDLAEITLKKPLPEKPEPRPETGSETIKGTNSIAEGVGAAGALSASGGAKGIVEQLFAIAKAAGGDGVYVGSAHRPGDTVASGGPSDHSQNNSNMAARDIGVRGINLLTGPPSPKLDKGVVAIGKALGRDYGDGKSGAFQNADDVQFRGYRVQIIWRTTKWGGHMGHIHVGARKN